MKSQDFLDLVKARHGIPSDNKLAQFLDVPQGRLSLVRTGTRKIDDAMAVKIAAALDLPVGYVLAEIQAERAKRTDLARVWHEVAVSLKKAGMAAVLLAVLIAGAPLETVRAAASFSGDNLYIMRRTRKKRRRD